jgi:FkbM family methyltransferase
MITARMSTLDRVIGLSRSLAIYHGVPGRQRRLRHLYVSFARSGDLVFDIGAHAGNHVRAFHTLGCRVVAVEPQPDFARMLRAWLGRSGDVSIVEAAVGEREGRASLAISERTPTVTSLAAAWLDDRAREPGFAGVRWNRQLQIEMTTLDALIARFGRPAFVKIDVEGSEPAVLQGLSQPLPALCFEYLPGAVAQTEACVARLLDLGPYRFNWSVGESYRFAASAWLDGDELMASMRSADGKRRSGDVYAKHHLGPN